MKVSIQSSTLSGQVTAPASKSAMQRACAAALLHRGQSYIYNPGKSNDDKVALSIIRALGATTELQQGRLEVYSNGLETLLQAQTGTIHCGESGLSIRMFAPICALTPHKIKLEGSGSLRNRPMHFFEEVLPQLGVQVSSNKGLLPLCLQGPLQARSISVDGSLSSQYITGLLMAYAALEAKDVQIHILNPVSKPYLALSLQVLRDFGLPYPRHEQLQTFIFDGASAHNKNEDVHYTVEGDWSNAAFWLVAALRHPINIRGLDLNSVQADKRILEVLQQCGANVHSEQDVISVEAGELQPFSFDATDSPDLFPPLVALAAMLPGTSQISGVHRLQHKESNRAQSLQSEFGKLGLAIHINGNTMYITGGQRLKGADCHAHNDHRIAMALSIAASIAQGSTHISNAESVQKSYPDFFEVFQSLGGQLQILEEG